jgi:cell division protein FtsB
MRQTLGSQNPGRLARPAVFMGVLTLIIVGMALITAVIPFRQILEQQARVASDSAELSRISIENELLSEEVEALNTPEEIERLARENLGYVMPGETAYVVLEPAESATLPSAPPVVDNEDDVPWYLAIWNFFTGADLSGG